MKPGNLLYLIVFGVGFAIWLALMIRMLWQIGNRARAMRGPDDGPGKVLAITLRAHLDFFRAPENRRFLGLLLLLSVLLMGMNVLAAYLLAPT